ncbi:hypothetical protein G6Z15_16720, partial [Clostridium perfringens]
MDNIINFGEKISIKEKELLEDGNYIEELKEEVIDNISNLDERQLLTLNKLACQIQKEGKYTIITDDYKPRDKRRFVKMYINEVNELLMKAKSLNDMKVLLFLMKKMNYDTGEIIVPNAMIADEL